MYTVLIGILFGCFQSGRLPPMVGRMSPLHISTDFTRHSVPICPESDSPGEEDSDPWPSPRDQDTSQDSLPSIATKIDEKSINDNELSSVSKSSPQRSVTSTPLLTFGRPSIPPSMSPTLSTSSKMSARFPSSKRISKGTATYALSAFRMPIVAALFPHLASTPPRPLRKDFEASRVEQVVKYIYDKRTKSVKHFCKGTPIEIDNEHLPDSEMDYEDSGTSVWPGPVLSDEDLRSANDKPVSDPDTPQRERGPVKTNGSGHLKICNVSEETDDSEDGDAEIEYYSDDGAESPPLHPRWACKKGCKHHAPQSLSTHHSSSEFVSHSDHSPPCKRRKEDLDQPGSSVK